MALTSGLLRTSTLRSMTLRGSAQSTFDAPYFSWDTNPVRGSAVRVFPVRGSALYKLYDVLSFKARARSIDYGSDILVPGLFCRAYTKVGSVGSIKYLPVIDTVKVRTYVDARETGVRFYIPKANSITIVYVDSQWASKAEVWPVLKVYSSNWITNAVYKYNGYYQLELDPDCPVFS